MISSIGHSIKAVKSSDFSKKVDVQTENMFTKKTSEKKTVSLQNIRVENTGVIAKDLMEALHPKSFFGGSRKVDKTKLDMGIKALSSKNIVAIMNDFSSRNAHTRYTVGSGGTLLESILKCDALSDKEKKAYTNRILVLLSQRYKEKGLDVSKDISGIKKAIENEDYKGMNNLVVKMETSLIYQNRKNKVKN